MSSSSFFFFSMIECAYVVNTHYCYSCMKSLFEYNCCLYDAQCDANYCIIFNRDNDSVCVSIVYLYHKNILVYSLLIYILYKNILLLNTFHCSIISFFYRFNVDLYIDICNLNIIFINKIFVMTYVIHFLHFNDFIMNEY